MTNPAIQNDFSYYRRTISRNRLNNQQYRCRFTNTDTMLFCMRVMVGVIILYDHVHPVGAFAKTSKIDVSSADMYRIAHIARP
ncbi:hypothetical protein GOODEAATRI_003764 [Goodea atripinnis]|uniref:CYRIA/CYRIB Rac1 binding domain-containing protein n=1 Tax=Goodea atripinnis TaxID=208336 RepID=A0ABV0N7M1_9TELE